MRFHHLINLTCTIISSPVHDSPVISYAIFFLSIFHFCFSFRFFCLLFIFLFLFSAEASNIDSWRLSSLGSESAHSSQAACMYAQYAHAAPSHSPYLNDVNFIAALRDKDKDKDKEKVKERGRDRNISDESGELYNISTLNDAREVPLNYFISFPLSFSPLPSPSLSFRIFLLFDFHSFFISIYSRILPSSVTAPLILFDYVNDQVSVLHSPAVIPALFLKYFSLTSLSFSIPPSTYFRPINITTFL